MTKKPSKYTRELVSSRAGVSFCLTTLYRGKFRPAPTDRLIDIYCPLQPFPISHRKNLFLRPRDRNHVD